MGVNIMTIDEMISHKRTFASEREETFFRDIAAFSIVVNTKIGSYEASGQGFPMLSLHAVYRSFDYIAKAYQIEWSNSSQQVEDEAMDNLSYAHAMLVLAYYHASLGIASYYADLYKERMGKYARAELKGYAGVNNIYDALIEARRKYRDADKTLRKSTILSTESIFSCQAVHVINLSMKERQAVVDAVDEYADTSKELYIAGCNALPLYEEHRSRHDQHAEMADRILGVIDAAFSGLDIISFIHFLICK